MSFSETIFLFFLALVIFGPKKLPEIARQVGKMMNEFRRASNEFKAQIEQEIAHLEVEERRRTILPPSPPPEGTTSRTLNAAPTESSVLAEAKPGDSGNGAAPATLAELSPAQQKDEQPASGSDAVTAELPATEAVAPSPSQESHA
jgi:sec-independent protein translocase protein TatB